MKKTFVVALGSLSILLGSHSYAGCGGCVNESYCYEQESPCACTDPGWKYNDCMSKAEFCAAFGNMGAMED